MKLGKFCDKMYISEICCRPGVYSISWMKSHQRNPNLLVCSSEIDQTFQRAVKQGWLKATGESRIAERILRFFSPHTVSFKSQCQRNLAKSRAFYCCYDFVSPSFFCDCQNFPRPALRMFSCFYLLVFYERNLNSVTLS